jgi:predicted nucleic acid-binding protein
VNVVLDIVLDRPPFAEAASALWAAAERKEIAVFVPAHGVTTVFYVAARLRHAAFARRAVNELLVVPQVAAVDEPVLRRALGLGWGDFEDAVCAAAAEAAGCEILVTRDPKGYPHSPVLAVDPLTALSLLDRNSSPGQVGERSKRKYRRRERKRAVAT